MFVRRPVRTRIVKAIAVPARVTSRGALQGRTGGNGRGQSRNRNSFVEMGSRHAWITAPRASVISTCQTPVRFDVPLHATTLIRASPLLFKGMRTSTSGDAPARVTRMPTDSAVSWRRSMIARVHSMGRACAREGAAKQPIVHREAHSRTSPPRKPTFSIAPRSAGASVNPSLPRTSQASRATGQSPSSSAALGAARTSQTRAGVGDERLASATGLTDAAIAGVACSGVACAASRVGGAQASAVTIVEAMNHGRIAKAYAAGTPFAKRQEWVWIVAIAENEKTLKTGRQARREGRRLRFRSNVAELRVMRKAGLVDGPNVREGL